MLVAGTVVADRFKLARQLGEGAMGAVWLAQHTQLDVPCAVKFILGEGAQSADLRARFEREAKAAAALRSPHVVGILDHGVWNGTPYIAMEYLEGEDLAARLARLGRLPPRDVVEITAQVARALAKAHAAGLVHRDLKPANVFLARDDDREIAKVLDFGIAKQNALGMADAGTKTGALMGTPYYMSPEQVQGTRALDHRSDLWSLGVVVFQCVTGALPFDSEALGDLLMKIMVNPPPVPSRIVPVPPAFDAWWGRASARDPAARFQSAKELAETLGQALGVAAVGAGIGAASSGVASAPGAPARSFGAGTIGMAGNPAFAASPPATTLAVPGLAQSPGVAPFSQSPPVAPFSQSPGVAPFAASPSQAPALGSGPHAFAPQPPSAPSSPGATVLAGAWAESLAATAGTFPRAGAETDVAMARPKSRAPLAIAVVAVLGALVALVVWAARPTAVAEAPAASSSTTTVAPAAAPAPATPAAPSAEPAGAGASADAPPVSASSSSPAASSSPPAARPATTYRPRGPLPGAKPSEPKDKDLVRW